MQLGLDDQEEVDSSIICHVVNQINSNGVWFGDDPLSFSVPLLLLQLSLISIFTRALHFLLKPFGQPSIVSQILGGVVLGPSIIGRNQAFASKVFPPKGRAIFDMLSVFGFMLFVFLIGVKMDPNMVLRSGKRGIAIGFLSFSVPYILSGFFGLVMERAFALDRSLSAALPSIVGLQSLTAFPSVACFLDELWILNSEMGRLASSSSIACDVLYFSVAAVKFVAHLAAHKSVGMSIGYLSSVGLLVVLIVYGIRPAVLWAIRQTPEGEPAKDLHVFAIIVTLMVCGFLGEVVGVNAFIPSFVLGLVIPDGPPLGVALVEKLDCFVSALLMPIFFTMCGLRMNVFAIQKVKNLGVIQLIVFTAFFGKVIGSALPPIFDRMPVVDALSLGLIMNAKGVVEIFLLLTWKADDILDEESFSVMVISLLVITGIVSPLVRAIYDPSKRFLAYRRRTILHHRPGEELRMLACVHRQENVPAVLDVIAASNATADSPISLVVLHLVKLVGRASSLLVPYNPHSSSSSGADDAGHRQHRRRPSQTERIFNAFHNLESRHVAVQCYKGVSPYATMHNDVCSVALERRSTLIVLPHHKVWVGGSAESSHCLRHLNASVLDKAPCSVAVLVDRGGHRGALSPLRVTASSSSHHFRVAVLFFGGPDDREALAYAARMAKHPNVLSTLFCFAHPSAEDNAGAARGRVLDTEILSKFRLSAFRDDRVSFSEVTVADGAAVMRVLAALDGSFDLVVVGRRREESSWVTSELGNKWTDRGELGTVGEILASSDVRIVASVLVVQQQTRVWGLRDPEESTGLKRDTTRQVSSL